jgi:hypothetical protein
MEEGHNIEKYAMLFAQLCRSICPEMTENSNRIPTTKVL